MPAATAFGYTHVGRSSSPIGDRPHDRSPTRLPPILGTMSSRFVTGAQLSSKVTVKLSWWATDPGSGVKSYDVQQSTNGGASWTTIYSGTTARSSVHDRWASGPTTGIGSEPAIRATALSAWSRRSTFTPPASRRPPRWRPTRRAGDRPPSRAPRATTRGTRRRATPRRPSPSPAGPSASSRRARRNAARRRSGSTACSWRPSTCTAPRPMPDTTSGSARGAPPAPTW